MLIWTVYVGGELFDLMTDTEVEELLEKWKVIRINSAFGVIEF